MDSNAPILVPTDFSPPAARAADYAAAWAKHLGAPIALVHVLPGTLDSLPFLTMLSRAKTAEVEAEQVAAAEQQLAAEAERLGATGRVVRGRSDEAILAEAERLGAGLIVIGSAGRDGIERAVLGSVAERVLRNSRGAVLVVR